MSSYDEILKKLRRKFPAPPEVKRALDEADKQPDRIAAIVIPAILEGLLQRLIEGRFPALDATLSNRVFERRGPLADFAGKIDIARAMGWIGQRTCDDLHFVREIRNVFAHSAIELTFDTDEIIKLIDRSPLVNEVRGSKVMRSTARVSHRGAFITTCYMAAIQLHWHHRDGGGEVLIAGLGVFD